MKLRKMVTVSAAALMLAGVGASATNAGSSVHASRRTVRISNLRRKSTSLTHQIKSDKYQIKNINRKIARLSRKTAKRGKRSKKTVKRHKRAKRINKESSKKQVRRSKRNRKGTKNNKKLTTQQKKQQQMIQKYIAAQKVAAQKERTLYHVEYGNKVYKVEMNGLGQTLSKKPYMSVKAYQRKNAKPLAKTNKALSKMIAPVRNNRAGMQKLESTKKFQKLYQNHHNLSLYIPKVATKK